MILGLYNEYDKYCYQYNSAIFRLLDKNPYVSNMIYPLANLIHQRIENELKIKESYDNALLKEEVTENEILGTTIKIRHENDLISTYQSLSEINIKVDDVVTN